MPFSQYPKVIIQYCAKCKWQNRAVWYLQEVLQTFNDFEKNLVVKEVSVQPSFEQPGLFLVILLKTEEDELKPLEEVVIYKKKFKKTTEAQNDDFYYDGFPDSKFLKTLIRDQLSPDEKLGHIDKYQGDALVECKVCERE